MTAPLMVTWTEPLDERAAQLAGMIADLDGYIERRAAELAAPLIEASRLEVSRADEAVEWADQRRAEVTAECHRQIAALEKRLARALLNDATPTDRERAWADRLLKRVADPAA